MTIQIFEYDGTKLRGELIDGEPWWVGKDVCAILEIEKHHQALANLPDDERGTYSVGTPSGHQQMTCISESGLYRLIFKSRKPEAERFKTWVVKEVLPQIRRTGSYVPEDITSPVLTERYLALMDEHMELLKWKADYFEKAAQPKPKRRAAPPLTQEDYAEIKRLHETGFGVSAIAREMGRANSTISTALRLVQATSQLQNGEAS